MSETRSPHLRVGAILDLATAMLETLVRWNGPPPGNQHFGGSRCQRVPATKSPTPGPWWTGIFRTAVPSARRFGHRWYADKRSAILIVPSVVARVERNVIINASHPEFLRLIPGTETPVWWDERLFV